MNLPNESEVVFSEVENRITTGGNTELILGSSDSKNNGTLSIPFGYQVSSFDEEKGSISCFMNSSFIEEYKKLEKKLLNKAKALDIMANVISVKSSVKSLKDGKEFLQVKCGKNTQYYLFKDGKPVKVHAQSVVKGTTAIVAARVLLWKFEVGGKQTMGISLLADEVMITGEAKKATKKRIKTLAYVKQQKKGKMMDHKDLEELNL